VDKKEENEPKKKKSKELTPINRLGYCRSIQVTISYHFIDRI